MLPIGQAPQTNNNINSQKIKISMSRKTEVFEILYHNNVNSKIKFNFQKINAF